MISCTKKSVLVGMSGGVDSSAAVLLLLEQGYEVIGCMLEMHTIDEAAKKRASTAAEKLGIPLCFADAKDDFKSKVIEPFIYDYFNGRTPNPCILCNPTVKFNQLIKKADELGCSYISTGHYSKILYNGTNNNDSRALLYKSQSKKDQSYMLYRLTQSQLKRLILPLSDMSKDEIRAKATAAGLDEIAQAKDSQEICFINGSHTEYIKNYAKINNISVKKGGFNGNFIDEAGKILGQHDGIFRFTIGQRKGLGISFGCHMFVTAIDAKNNTVTLGNGETLYCNEITADNAVFIPFHDRNIPNAMRVSAKVRYAAKPADADFTYLGGNKFKLVFDKPERAPTAGQSVVIYDGDIVLGGGIII